MRGERGGGPRPPGRPPPGRGPPVRRRTPPTAAAPHADPEARDEAARLRAALAGLAPEQRAALALRFDGGLTFAEAAAALGEPVSTVKSRTRTAIARLRGSLAAPPAPVGAARRD